MKMNGTFREKICKYIEDNGLNPTSFSKTANIPSSVTHNIINSKNPNPTIDTAIKIANSMNCTLDELCRNKTQPPDEASDLALLNSICAYMCALKEIKGIHFNGFCEVLLQIYNYCKDNGLKKVDTTYANWYIKKVYKNDIL